MTKWGSEKAGDREVTTAPQMTDQVAESLAFRTVPSQLHKGPTMCSGRGGRPCDDRLPNYMGSAAAAATRTLQPFSTPVLRSPGMPTCFVRHPFTLGQWQELERQALIYKCMLSSVSIPPELLTSSSMSYLSPHPALSGGGSFNARLSNNADPEPGRCRRTDGKKWRCSRDVAPDQKYCERHMHRGRPRSRKPVEPPPESNASCSIPSAGCSMASASISNSATASVDGSSQLPPSLSRRKASYRDLCFAVSGTQSGCVEWSSGVDNQLTGDQTWAVQQYRGGHRESINVRSDPVLYPQYEDGLRLNFCVFGDEDTESQPADQECSFIKSAFLDSDDRLPHCFMSALSTCPPSITDADANNNGGLGHHSPTKQVMSSLTLSIPTSNDDGDIQMCVDVGDSERDNAGEKQFHLSWTSSFRSLPSPLGGPLGEVLQSSTSICSTSVLLNRMCDREKGSRSGLSLGTDGWAEWSNPHQNQSPGRAVASPTDVLQRTLAPLSDSSGHSSPTFAVAKSDEANRWLNHSAI